MRGILGRIAMMTLTVLSVTSAQQTSILLQQFREIAEANGIVLGIAVEDLGTGERILLNEREMFHAASTMKTPVMIEVFYQAEQGKVGLDDSIEVRNQFKSIVDGSPYSMDLKDDSDDAIYALIGKRSTIRSLVFQMITVSSNLATNILIDKVGAAKVTGTMRKLGAKDIQVRRGVEDSKAFERGLNNETNALDLMLIFRALAKGQAVGRASDSSMVDVLLQQKFRDKIPGKLPKEVKVAHKTGNITGVEHDSGIVYLPDGRSYVIVLLSKGWKDQSKAKDVLSDISRKVYDYVCAQGN